MIRILCVLALLITLPASEVEGQKKYITAGGELILSWASAKQNGADVTTITRFSPFFNIQTQFHYDAAEKLGFFTGINVRNVGFIFDDPVTAKTRYKVRTYTLGIPFAIKLGEVSRSFLFGGYELGVTPQLQAKRVL